MRVVLKSTLIPVSMPSIQHNTRQIRRGLARFRLYLPVTMTSMMDYSTQTNCFVIKKIKIKINDDKIGFCNSVRVVVYGAKRHISSICTVDVSTNPIVMHDESNFL